MGNAGPWAARRDSCGQLAVVAHLGIGAGLLYVGTLARSLGGVCARNRSGIRHCWHVCEEPQGLRPMTVSSRLLRLGGAPSQTSHTGMGCWLCSGIPIVLAVIRDLARVSALGCRTRVTIGIDARWQYHGGAGVGALLPHWHWWHQGLHATQMRTLGTVAAARVPPILSG